MDAFSAGSMLSTTSNVDFNYSYNVVPEVPDGCVVLNVTTEFIPWDNPHNLISRSVANTWNRMVYGILLPLLCLISFPCNILNTVIFFKHGIKQRINLCLFFLSLVDLIYMLQAFCHYSEQIYFELTHQPLRGALIQFMLRNYLSGLFGFGWMSSWITTIIACERCFCVVSPLRSQTVLKTKTMWIIILLPSTVLVGVFFVINAKWDIVCVFYPSDNTTQHSLYPSDFFLRNKDLIDTLDSVMFGLIIPQFCVITVTIATIITVIKLKSMTEWREKSSLVAAAMSSRDVALTRMLVGTSVLFIISFIPRSFMRVAMFFVQGLSLGGHLYNTYAFLLDTATLFTFINSSLNFPVYCIFASKFRTTLETLFCKARVANLKDCRH